MNSPLIPCPPPSHAKDIEVIAERGHRFLAEQGLNAPLPLVADISALLVQESPEILEHRDLPTYERLLRQLTRGERWCTLHGLLAPLRPIGSERLSSQFLDVVYYLSREILEKRLPEQELVWAGDRNPLAALERVAAEWFRQVEAGEVEKRKVEDVGSYLVLPELFVYQQLVQNVRSLNALLQTVNLKLVSKCLREEPSQDEHEPRRLQIVVVNGSKTERNRGDLAAVRGITVMTREEQLKHGIVTEFAPLLKGAKGRRHVFHKVLNKELLILEHHDDRQPVIRHRTFLALFIYLDVSTKSELDSEKRADILGKAIAYDMLVDAALKTPHEKIVVDVALFIHRGKDGWRGTGFPLRRLGVSGDPAENWRNVLEVARVSPNFFFLQDLHPRLSSTEAFEVLRGDPAGHLRTAAKSQTYQAVVVASFSRPRHRSIALPPANILLPRVVKGVANTLTCWTEDGCEGYWGGMFPSLMAAHVANSLPRASKQSLVRKFTTMLVGPTGEKGAAWTLE